MTIIIGAIHDHRVIVGTDSMWTLEDNLIREFPSESKFLKCPDPEVLIAGSGDDKYSVIFEEFLIEKGCEFNSKRDLFLLTNAFRNSLPKWGMIDDDHDFGFVVAKKGHSKLWSIECNFSVNECDDWICLGGGSTLGEASMKALALRGIFGREAIETSLQVVGSLHPFCGGRSEFRELVC